MCLFPLCGRVFDLWVRDEDGSPVAIEIQDQVGESKVALFGFPGLKKVLLYRVSLREDEDENAGHTIRKQAIDIYIYIYIYIYQIYM